MPVPCGFGYCNSVILKNVSIVLFNNFWQPYNSYTFLWSTVQYFNRCIQCKLKISGSWYFHFLHVCNLLQFFIQSTTHHCELQSPTVLGRPRINCCSLSSDVYCPAALLPSSTFPASCNHHSELDSFKHPHMRGNMQYICVTFHLAYETFGSIHFAARDGIPFFMGKNLVGVQSTFCLSIHIRWTPRLISCLSCFE